MRDIKFRGLRTCSAVWVYGSLIICNNYKIRWVHNPLCNDFTDVVVIAESVGQFTGLKDLDGNDVYEGDIVEFTTYEGGGFGRLGIKCKAVVVYGEYNLQDNVLGGSIGFYLKSMNSEYPISINYWLYSHKALVTGNIHENN